MRIIIRIGNGLNFTPYLKSTSGMYSESTFRLNITKHILINNLDCDEILFLLDFFMYE